MSLSKSPVISTVAASLIVLLISTLASDHAKIEANTKDVEINKQALDKLIEIHDSIEMIKNIQTERGIEQAIIANDVNWIKDKLERL